MEETNHRFTGVFIPAEIYERNDISWAEKILWCEISALAGSDVCWATNEYFAKKFNTTPEKISAKISKLKKLGYVIQVGFDGRRRQLKPVFTLLKPQEEDTSVAPAGQGSITYNGKAALPKTVRQDYQNGQGFYNKMKDKEEIKVERDINTHRQSSFIPPTSDDLLAYAREMNKLAVESGGKDGFYCAKAVAEHFWVHYEACGWYIGKGVQMYDWKAKLREWCFQEAKKEAEKFND